jgi:hypothetical protein
MAIPLNTDEYGTPKMERSAFNAADPPTTSTDTMTTPTVKLSQRAKKAQRTQRALRKDDDG